MQHEPRYQDVVDEVREYLHCQVDRCLAAGIERERLTIDPGFGFGKTLQHNLALWAHLEMLRVDDLPLMVGLSRKSSLGLITGQSVEHRQAASIAAAVTAAERGADILRVHDVPETIDAMKVLQAVREAATS